ncbi:LegC family aminotransferase [Schaedlerella arabinosiphila]|uniref:LegC family aminotransferase n=1 Tax=Schaedlerella arabinosiphila TaxID=2044587 RepID=A0A9X5C6V8_9FIRM|nr:LegC family aminotransferase [Schaedlerella arabinosiphila]NDO68683.1 LegC family aminotransferase [Schaedlerella arabinosiphila]
MCRNKFIPLSVPNLKGNELAYVTEAVKTEWVSTAGPFIADFEHQIAEYVKVPGAAACQSGTAGLHLSLMALGVKAGDEVIVPTLTFIAAVNPIRYIGAEPIFMDCDDSLTMDAGKLKKFCENECEFRGETLFNKKTGKRVSAVIVVHIFGNLADMEQIISIAEMYHLKVLEDATEALGSYYLEGTYSGNYAGTIGTMGVYSFNGNKIITTGGGGMIVSQNPDLAERCRFLSTQAKKDSLYFVHEEVGFNYRMTNLQAAFGLAQLEQLEDFIKVKQKNYERYICQGVALLPFKENIRSNAWFYSYATKNRDGLIRFLDKHQVQSRPVWQLIHTLKPYRGCQAYQVEKAYQYYECIVNLPCSSNLSETDVDRVAELVKKFEKSDIGCL